MKEFIKAKKHIINNRKNEESFNIYIENNFYLIINNIEFMYGNTMRNIINYCSNNNLSCFINDGAINIY